MDAWGFFDALTAESMGKLSDKSTFLYASAYRDYVRRRVLEKLHWVPTESMLSDDLTKFMEVGSGLWRYVYLFAYWQPFSRPELKEDWVTWTQDGRTRRLRLGDVVLDFLRDPVKLEEMA